MGTKTNISIRNQLILVVGLITTFIIIATGLVRSWNTYDQKQNELIRSTSILAAVTADNTTAALSFGDIDSATELLAALKQEPAIREAGVFDNQGELFVRYRAAGVAQPYLTSNYQQFDEGVSFAKRYFMVTQPVMNKGARLGTVVLRTTMQPAYESLQRTLLWELVTLIVCVLTAIFLAFRFQGLISKPLLNLSNVAKDVSDNKDYSVRVGVDQGPAEVQRLIVAFNTMLDQVQTHDEELAQANRQLEERVKVRTKELEEANRSMEMVQFAVQNAQTAILILDKDGDVIEINNKARELFPKNNVDLIESIHGWEFNKWSDLWDKLIEEETLSEYDLLLTGSGVENLPIELFAAYLDYHDNNYVCLFIRDISQRKLVESRLSQAQKLESIGQLASGNAH